MSPRLAALALAGAMLALPAYAQVFAEGRGVYVVGPLGAWDSNRAEVGPPPTFYDDGRRGPAADGVGYGDRVYGRVGRRLEPDYGVVARGRPMPPYGLRMDASFPRRVFVRHQLD